MLSTEELLIKILNHLSDRFKGKLVLKGGLLLRLYNSPRSTQDLDYILPTTESRKVWKKKVIEALKELDDLEIAKVDLNSRGIFIHINEKGASTKAILEISVASTHLAPEPISTASISQKYSMSGKVVSTMALPEAFAHKIAAALEREAIRDLYDLSQLEASGFFFDPTVLAKRLSALAVNRAKPASFTLLDAGRMLREKMNLIDQKKVEAELYPLLPHEFRLGVLGVMKMSVGRIAQRLEAMGQEKPTSEA